VTADYEMDAEIFQMAPFLDRKGEPFGVEDALLSLPTLSIVMERRDLFGPRGIYLNPRESGIAWERPASVEFIDPAGGPEFQVNCGIRIHGGWSRDPHFFKHSFRLYFRSTYGSSLLRFPLFPDTEVNAFDKLVLRAGSDDGWVLPRSWSRRIAQYQRDQFARDIQRDMGQLTSHGRFVHLYLNGLYWGLYNCIERPDADFFAAHRGGAGADYDVIKTGAEIQDGLGTAWHTLMGLAEEGLAGDAAYRKIQSYLDVDNLIDYFIANIYLCNVDWPHNNWYAGRERRKGAGFQFICWDSEEVLYHDPSPRADIRHNRTDADAPNSPGRLYRRLRENPEFRLRFGDRVHRHFFQNGVLTPRSTVNRWMARAAEIDRAIVAESARWGDLHAINPFTREDWLQEQRFLINSYFTAREGPNRSEIVLSQFRSAGLYPGVEAPRLLPPGGKVPAGTELALAAPLSGRFYSPLLSPGASCRVLVPDGESPGPSWSAGDFDDSGWMRGSTGVGYERGTGYAELIRTDVAAHLTDPGGSIYIRVAFQIDDLNEITALRLKMKYDDGFVAYLNGREVARKNAPSRPVWNSASTEDHEAEAYEMFPIGHFREILHAGRNLLAIQGLNTSNATSSDFLILPVLEAGRDTGHSRLDLNIYYTLDGSDPRAPGGAVASGALTYGEPLVLERRAHVKSRALVEGTWSALAEARYSIEP